MPRAWTPPEQDRVRTSLLDAGRDLFVRHGLKKVTIAELARAAGIGKGSFYLLFDSKEALFFEIQEREEASFKAAVVERLGRADSPQEGIRAFAYGVATDLSNHPFLRLITDQETLLALQRRVSPEALAAHRASDRAWIVEIVRGWREAGSIRDDIADDVIFGCFAAFYALVLQSEVVGDRFDEVVDVLARGLGHVLTARQTRSPRSP